jgi:hypothetical protein
MTKEFRKIQFDPVQCREEVKQLQDLLATHCELQERKQVLPFFKERLQLSALLGMYHSEIHRYDLVAHELPLFGDFIADLVIGDSKNSAFAFIEFEDASPESIFVKRKATPDWSPRFERGFSQLIDWFFKLDEQKQTVDFEDKFGSRTIQHVGLIVIGRTEHLGKREEQRFRWRQKHVLINSATIYCKTFDQLCNDFLAKLEQFRIGVEAEEKTANRAQRDKDKTTDDKTPNGSS